MIRCNWIIRKGPLRGRFLSAVPARAQRWSLKVPLNRRKLKIVKVQSSPRTAAIETTRRIPADSGRAAPIRFN